MGVKYGEFRLKDAGRFTAAPFDAAAGGEFRACLRRAIWDRSRIAARSERHLVAQVSKRTRVWRGGPRSCREFMVRERQRTWPYVLADDGCLGDFRRRRPAAQVRIWPRAADPRRQSEPLVQREQVSKLPERRGDATGELRDAVYQQLRPGKSLDLVARIAPGVRLIRTLEESGPLAVGCHRRLGARHSGRILEQHAPNAVFGSDPAARHVGRILQAILAAFAGAFRGERPDPRCRQG